MAIATINSSIRRGAQLPKRSGYIGTDPKRSSAAPFDPPLPHKAQSLHSYIRISRRQGKKLPSSKKISAPQNLCNITPFWLHTLHFDHYSCLASWPQAMHTCKAVLYLHQCSCNFSSGEMRQPVHMHVHWPAQARLQMKKVKHIHQECITCFHANRVCTYVTVLAQ